MTDIPQAHSNDAIVGREQAACLQLRLEGHSFRAIADQLGLSLGTAYSRVRAAVDLEVNPKADELREIEVQRLDLYLARLAPKIAEGDDRAINTAVRISESRRRMLGLDRPVAIDATVTEASQQDLELQEMIRLAKTKAAVEEAAILAERASKEEQ